MSNKPIVFNFRNFEKLKEELDRLRFKIEMGLIPDWRMIPRVRIRKPGWEGMR